MSLAARNRFARNQSPSGPTTTIETIPRSYSPVNSLSSSVGDMSGKDRTDEFKSAVRMLHTPQSPAQPISHKEALHQKSQFMKIARHIGKDIGNTFTKLDALTAMCKRKSLFDDKQAEIQELTYIIKQDVQGLNGQIAQLQQLAQHQKGQSSQHMQSHSSIVVMSLQTKLASMSNNFKTVLEERTENLKETKSRRDEHFSTQLPPSSQGAAAAGGGPAKGSVLWQDEMNSRGEVSIDMPGQAGAGSHFQDQMQIIGQQDEYLSSRADTMKNIESTIVELGGIFSQLAHMVKEQEETVQRIDANIEDTHLNVDAAHSQILQYFQSVSSNRWLMIKIFGVLIFFFIIFIVFMA